MTTSYHAGCLWTGRVFQDGNERGDFKNCEDVRLDSVEDESELCEAYNGGDMAELLSVGVTTAAKSLLEDRFHGDEIRAAIIRAYLDEQETSWMESRLADVRGGSS